jgi:uncharacterized protein (UPF0332 family)
MKESSQRLLEKAAWAIEAADTLLENGLSEFSTGRAYYAMFYTAEKLLTEKDLVNVCQDEPTHLILSSIWNGFHSIRNQR